MLDYEDPSCSCPGRGGKGPPYFPPLKVDDKNSLKAPALLKPKPKRPLSSPSPSGVDNGESTLSSSAPAQTTVAEGIVDYRFELDRCHRHRSNDELNKALDNVLDALATSYREMSELRDLYRESMRQKLSIVSDKAGLDADVVQKIKSDMGLLRSTYN